MRTTHTPKPDEVPVKSIRTMFEIVETIQELDGAGVSEVATHVDLPKSTVHDHLRTLHDLGYLVVGDEDGKKNGTYHVGTHFLSLGGFARKRRKVYRVAKPEIESLAETTGEHANLLVEEHGLGIFLEKVEGENAVQLDTYVGMQVHLHTTALGKSILAHLPEERVDAIIDRYGLAGVTERTITDRAELDEQLREIRQRGYSIDVEERVEGMRCIAAPITGPEDRVCAAVSVSAPTSRMEGERFEEQLPKQVLRTANVIEVNITYS